MTHIEGVDDGHGYGVRGRSPSGGHGVRGLTGNAVFDPNFDNNNVGVFGKSDDGMGVLGRSNTGDGVLGVSRSGIGAVHGINDISTGVSGESEHGIGVVGTSQDASGVSGFSTKNNGVFGESNRSIGVHGKSGDSKGVLGSSSTDAGVEGTSPKVGVRGLGSGVGGIGIAGVGNDVAVFGWGGNFAGSFIGNVDITGSLTVDGTKSFKIDHPLDPSNKYLYHSSVESPDMKNVYDGVVVLDDKGEAVVVLPGWFEALNKEFRYQLTPISAPAPNLYIAEEIKNQRFKIAGGS